MLAPYWGTELFAVINLTLDGDSEGIQSRIYTKKAGAYALKVAFETAVKDAAGYKKVEEFMHSSVIVALPLTSFKPASRNTISRESIKL